MKKLKIFVIALLTVFISMNIVKADGGLNISSVLLTPNVYVGDDIHYNVIYSYGDYGYDSSFNIKFDSSLISFESIKDTNLNSNLNLKSSFIDNDKGFIKIDISNVKESDKEIKLVLTFKANKIDTNALINLSVPTCENDIIGDCDPFWFGNIDEKSKRRTINIAEKVVADNNNFIQKEIKEKNETVVNDDNLSSDTIDAKKNSNTTNILLYCSLGFNVILVIVLAIYIFKKNNKKEKISANYSNK